MANKKNITLSVPRDLYDRMKKHPEVKWSQAAREGIIQKLTHMEGFAKKPHLYESLPTEVRKGIDEISGLTKEDWKKHHGKTKELEWKRAKSWTQAY
ncbi:hypothetical protein HY640_02530 [Candidatus Woesearchaeota archaeon]|nr:hypothetical protein [Candidatus Woesearchaeota archaeon]